MEIDKYPAPTWKRRLLVLALAVGAALFIVHMLTIPPTPVAQELVPPIRDQALCQAGQTQNCVGGTAVMIMAPAPLPSSASALASPPASAPAPAPASAPR